MKDIFKWFTIEDEKTAEYIYWFKDSFKETDFEGIDRLFYCYIEYCAFLDILPKRNYLDYYLKTEAKRDMVKYNIKTDAMGTFDYKQSSQVEEAYQILCSLASEVYDTYCEVDLTDRNFKVDMMSFMRQKHSESIYQAVSNYLPKITDGSDVLSVSEGLQHALVSADEAYDVRKLESVSGNKNNAKMRFIAKTGIPCVDDTDGTGGIYTKCMTTLNGQPGAGKTRISLAYWVYPILVNAKKDVAYFETELSQGQVENILIAHHIVNVYRGKIKIPDTLMNEEGALTREQEQIYESAKIDLFESGKYGKFIFHKGVLTNTFKKDIVRMIKSNPNFKYFCVDYAGLAKYKPESKYEVHKDQYQVITDVYEAARDILLDHDVGALILNQYNDKGIDAAYAGRPIRSGYIQGGHIVHRHTDFDLSMTFTEEQELAGVFLMSLTKTRGSAGFKNVMFQKDMSISKIEQVAKQEG